MGQDEAIELCDEILSELDELPDRAGDFADSVREKVESIQAFAEERGYITEAQADALLNMQRGVQRWRR